MANLGFLSQSTCQFVTRPSRKRMIALGVLFIPSPQELPFHLGAVPRVLAVPLAPGAAGSIGLGKVIRSDTSGVCRAILRDRAR